MRDYGGSLGYDGRGERNMGKIFSDISGEICDTEPWRYCTPYMGEDRAASAPSRTCSATLVSPLHNLYLTAFPPGILHRKWQARRSFDDAGHLVYGPRVNEGLLIATIQALHCEGERLSCSFLPRPQTSPRGHTSCTPSNARTTPVYPTYPSLVPSYPSLRCPSPPRLPYAVLCCLYKW